MKILCLTPYFPVFPENPVGRFVVDSVESLASSDCQFVVLLATPRKSLYKKNYKNYQYGEHIKLNECQYFSIPRCYFRFISNWFLTRMVARELEKLVKENLCQLIHVHTELFSLPAIEVGKRLGIPVVVTVHGYESSKHYWPKLKKPVGKALSLTDKVILVGESLLPSLEKIIGCKDNFLVVPNGFKERSFEEKGIPCCFSDNLKFVAVANLGDDEKGIDYALKAFCEFKKTGNDSWSYTIIGDGALRKTYEKLASELGIEKNVHFVGSCAHDKVFEYLKDMDVFILPSHSEAFGIAYVEAMSLGLLTIGVRGQGPETFIDHGVTGFLVNPRDVNSIIETLKKIFNDKQKMRAIAQAGKATVWANFTWKQHASKLMEVYRSVL